MSLLISENNYPTVSRIAYLGLRDVDPPEQAVLESLGIASYYIQVIKYFDSLPNLNAVNVLIGQDLDRLGVRGALDEALTRIDPGGQRPIHLRFL